jgi:uncharacterized protein YciI
VIRPVLLMAATTFALASGGAAAQSGRDANRPAYDENLARSVGADENGMRSYVLVVLKTGPNPVPAGPGRDAMFRGHFANMKRLTDEGTLVFAGPFDGVDGWRGLFILAVPGIEEAKTIIATDPVVAKGEMVPEFHTLYGSAALMLMPDAHARVAKKQM